MMSRSSAGRWVLAAVLFVALLATSCSAMNVTISVNTRHLHDTAGHIINAHDGSLIWVNGTFYIFGTVYQLCKQNQAYCNAVCGYFNNTFAAYSSPDMSNGSWALLSTNILPAVTKNNDKVTYLQPNVNYNNVTKKWVMVYIASTYTCDKNIAVATSDLPQGPFVDEGPITISPPPIAKGMVVGSTVGLFLDTDTGAAYLRYNGCDQYNVIELLDETWTRTTGRSALAFANPILAFPQYEGGGMFKRNGLFYMTVGVDCCFCQWGADTRVFVAKDPLGKWTPQQSKRKELTSGGTTTPTPHPRGNWSNEINPCANGKEPVDYWPTLNPGVNLCSPSNVQGTNFTVPAQQFFTATLPTGRPGEYTYMYYGEHFYSSPDGLKGHDLQAWIPFEFDGDVILPMRWLDTFTVEVP